jgi:hypothetical protein
MHEKSKERNFQSESQEIQRHTECQIDIVNLPSEDPSERVKALVSLSTQIGHVCPLCQFSLYNFVGCVISTLKRSIEIQY